MVASTIPKRILAGLVIIASGLSSARAAEITLFDSLTPAKVAGQSQSPATVEPTGGLVAQGFKTTVANFVVESVELEIYKQTGSTDVYSVWIYNSVSGLPGTSVANVALNQSQAALSDQPSSQAFNSLALTLSPNTDYFIVVGGVQSLALNWDYWDTATPSGVGIPTAGTTYDGTVWSAIAMNYPQMMKVNAASVPEPSTWLMGMIAATMIGGIARRKCCRKIGFVEIHTVSLRIS